MMKKFLFLLLFIPTFLQAQSPLVQFSTPNEHTNIEEVPKSYLLADSVLVRKCPETNCTAIAVATIGTPLTILAASANLDTINGIQSNWYQVKTADYTGWIWGGFIAQKAFGSHGEPDIKFVMGWESKKFSKGDIYLAEYQIRAFRFGKQIAQLSFSAAAETIDPWEIQNLGSKGLPVDDVIAFQFPCEGGCGCSAIETVIFWDGQQFHHVYDLEDTADAWASTNEDFIYPADMDGINGLIVRVYAGYLDSEYLEDGTERHKNVIQKVYYRWNGKRLVEADREMEERFYYQKN